jgi:acyl transferase domain-containing protein
MAETKKDALAAFDAFVETWGVKYDKAVECLIKDREALLAFYDFPAEHWKHLRTTNVIESSFATMVLVLQGGGALGAYQVGVYQALDQFGIDPNWVVGTSIGAINAAIIAGSPRAERMNPDSGPHCP